MFNQSPLCSSTLAPLLHSNSLRELYINDIFEGQHELHEVLEGMLPPGKDIHFFNTNTQVRDNLQCAFNEETVIKLT